jgi:hypothetical protein
MNTRRGEILDTAKGLTEGNRSAAYGEPIYNLTTAANLVKAYLDGMANEDGFNAVDMAAVNILIKISRIAVNHNHADNYIDAAAYAAIAGECAEQIDAIETAYLKGTVSAAYPDVPDLEPKADRRKKEGKETRIPVIRENRIRYLHGAYITETQASQWEGMNFITRPNSEPEVRMWLEGLRQEKRGAAQ